MTEFTKGGRGKKPPYDTTHHRIPEPCKDTVKLLSDTWKHLRSDEEEGEAKAQKLLTDIENLTTAHYAQDFNKPVNEYSEMLDTDPVEPDNKLGNKLIALLNLASTTYGTKPKEMKRIIKEAIELLEQNLQ